jgi:ubiquitin-protein ligase
MHREERLFKEYQKMEELISQSNLISFKAPGTIPDRYTVTFTCDGLAVENGLIVLRDEHIAVIFLHSKYPLQPPRVTWRTPIFHPNFRGAEVCIGEGWRPSVTVKDLCLILGEMIQYKNYNIDDPLNSAAAAWTHMIRTIAPDIFPVDDRNLLEPLSPKQSKKAELSERLGHITMPDVGGAMSEDIIFT